MSKYSEGTWLTDCTPNQFNALELKDEEKVFLWLYFWRGHFECQNDCNYLMDKCEHD